MVVKIYDKYKDMSPTLRDIMEYLEKELAHGARYISYTRIGQSLKKKRSKHSVAYSIDKLRRMGKIKIRDGKLSLI